MKTNVSLACENCNSRNYSVKKEKYSAKRIELKKFCPHCNKATLHKEAR